MTAFNYANMDPARREHFVYRAFDTDDNLLYVGCTMRLDLRYREHKGQSRWFPLAARFTMQGPYNYQTARRIEREAIHGEQPRWNHNEPSRLRLDAIRQRIHKRWFRLEYLIQGDQPENWWPAYEVAKQRADRLLPGTSDLRISGRFISSDEVAAAEQADLDDLEEYNTRVRWINRKGVRTA